MPHGLQASLRFQGLQFGKSCFKRGLLRKLMSARFWLARRAPLPLTTPSIPVCSLSWSRLRFTGQKIPSTFPLFCLQNLTAGDWVSDGIWTVASCQLARINQCILVRQTWKAKPTIRKLLFHWGQNGSWRYVIATQVPSCKHVVLGCVFEVVFLVDKCWQGRVSIKSKRFGRSAETCTRSISGKGWLNTRILYITLTYTRCRNILEFITITLALSWNVNVHKIWDMRWQFKI